jgi:hypothetical protein
MARPPGRQPEAASPSAARRAHAPRRGPRWSRSTSRTPTAATSGSSPGHRMATRITFRPGHPMAGRSSSSATPPAAAHQGRRSSWPPTSSPGPSGSSTGSPAGRRAPTLPPSRRMGSGSSSGTGASMATPAPPVRARKKRHPGHDPARRARATTVAAEIGCRQRRVVTRWQTDRIPLPLRRRPNVVQAPHLQPQRHRFQALALACGVRRARLGHAPVKQTHGQTETAQQRALSPSLASPLMPHPHVGQRHTLSEAKQAPPPRCLAEAAQNRLICVIPHPRTAQYPAVRNRRSAADWRHRDR